MTIERLRELGAHCGGKGALKFALSICLLASAVACSSRGYRSESPLGKALDATVGKIRSRLPETLETARRAMGGH